MGTTPDHDVHDRLRDLLNPVTPQIAFANPVVQEPLFGVPENRDDSVLIVDDDTSALTPAILQTHTVAHIKDPLARLTQRFLEGVVKNKAILEEKLSTSLVYPGVNKSAMKAIALCEFVDFNKLTTESISFSDSQNSLAIENGSLAVTTQLRAVPITCYAELQHALNVWGGATTLIYPHRTDEIKQYGMMLLDMVRSHKANINRVIEFDIAVRKRVATNCHLTLISDHTILRQHIFSAPGSFVTNTPPYTTDKGITRTQPKTVPRPKENVPRAEQVCEKFQKGLCPSPCKNARLHILKCGKCGKTGHDDRNCEKE